MCHIRGSWEESPQNAPFPCSFRVNLKYSEVNSILSKFTEVGEARKCLGWDPGSDVPIPAEPQGKEHSDQA